MIEREAKTDEDRALIARVIYNRLAAKMPLQVDATLYYGQDPTLPFDKLKAINRRTTRTSCRACRRRRSPTRAASRSRPRWPRRPTPTRRTARRASRALGSTTCSMDKTTGKHAFATNLADHEANVAKAKAAGAIP